MTISYNFSLCRSNSSFQQYLAFHEELRVHVKAFDTLRDKHGKEQLLWVNEDKWTTLQQKWSYVTSQTKVSYRLKIYINESKFLTIIMNTKEISQVVKMLRCSFRTRIGFQK